MQRFSILILLLLLLFHHSTPQDLRILCPYIGPITSEYSNEARQVRLHDNSVMGGVFFQWIAPETYQWNVFVYNAPNINYGSVWGGHLSFDYYIPIDSHESSTHGTKKIVVGCGTEYLRIDLDANANIAPFLDFTLLNKLMIPYIRCGYQYRARLDEINISFFPWVGVQYQGVRGSLSFTMDPPGPTPLFTRTEAFSSDKYFALTGININTRLFHALELETRYYGAFRNHEYLSNASWMLNVYLSRSLGISYRGKYIEFSNGFDVYNIVGIAVLF